MNPLSPKASFLPKTTTSSRPLEKLSRNSRSTINLNKSSDKQNTQRHSSPKQEVRLDQQLRNLVQRCEQSKNTIENINYSLHSKRFDMSPRDLEASKDLTQTILRNSTLSIFGSPPAAEKLGLNDLYSRKSAQNFFTSHKLDSEHSFSRSPIHRAPMQEHSNINFQKSPEKSKRYLSPIETEYLREDINNVLDTLSPTEKFQKFKSMLKDEEDDKENDNVNLEIQYNELKKYLQQFIANVEDLEHRNKVKDQELLQLRTQAQNNIEELLVQKDIREALEQKTKDLEANEEDVQEANLNNNMKITAQDKKIKNLEKILYDEEFKLKHFKTKAQEENQDLKRELFGLKEREKALNSTSKDMKDQIRDLESKLNTAVNHSQYAEKSSENKEEKIHILQQGINDFSLQQTAYKRNIEDLEAEINKTAERILEVRSNIKIDKEKVIKDANQEKMHRKQQSHKLKKEIQDSKMQANELIESNKLKRLRLNDVIRKRENLEKDKADVKRKLDNIEDEKYTFNFFNILIFQKRRFLTENLDKLKTQNSELLHNLKVQETKVKDTMKENNITQAKIQVIEGKLGYVDKVTKKAEELIKTVLLFFSPSNFPQNDNS